MTSISLIVGMKC